MNIESKSCFPQYLDLPGSHLDVERRNHYFAGHADNHHSKASEDIFSSLVLCRAGTQDPERHH